MLFSFVVCIPLRHTFQSDKRSLGERERERESERGRERERERERERASAFCQKWQLCPLPPLWTRRTIIPQWASSAEQHAASEVSGIFGCSSIFVSEHVPSDFREHVSALSFHLTAREFPVSKLHNICFHSNALSLNLHFNSATFHFL